MGEVSLGIQDWFGGKLEGREVIPVAFDDPANTVRMAACLSASRLSLMNVLMQPAWYPVMSSRRSKCSGALLIKIGFIESPDSSPTVTTDDRGLTSTLASHWHETYGHQPLSAHRAHMLSDYFVPLLQLQHLEADMPLAERVLSAPPVRMIWKSDIDKRLTCSIID